MNGQQEEAKNTGMCWKEIHTKRLATVTSQWVIFTFVIHENLNLEHPQKYHLAACLSLKKTSASEISTVRVHHTLVQFWKTPQNRPSPSPRIVLARSGNPIYVLPGEIPLLIDTFGGWKSWCCMNGPACEKGWEGWLLNRIEGSSMTGGPPGLGTSYHKWWFYKNCYFGK